MPRHAARHSRPDPEPVPRVTGEAWPDGATNPTQGAQDVRIHRRRTPRGIRLAASVVGLLALVGGAAAVKVTHDGGTPDPVTAARDDERASRDLIRPTVDTLTPSATSSPAATPTVAPTTPPPAPKPTPTPAPKKTTPTKAVAAAPAAGCASYTGNQLIACNLLPSFGFATSEMAALVPMWNKESGWNASAENPSSGAYGIPQALPGSKMASAGGDWQTNPATQIKWGLDYIKGRYGTPSAAWSFWQANGWY
jgi:hypothetical protein